MSSKVSVSLLTANFLTLSNDINTINESEADWFHLDVMDGVFVPNISFGFSIIETIDKSVSKPLDVHLMIVNPDKYIERFKNVGANILTVHYEACPHLHRVIQQIKKNGMKAGVAINPHTPTHLLNDVLQDIDLVLIMSVNPGFGGQKFIENTFKKVSELKEEINKRRLNVEIEVDGGVDDTNAKKLIQCGASILVSGSYVLSNKTPKEAINKLKKI